MGSDEDARGQQLSPSSWFILRVETEGVEQVHQPVKSGPAARA